LSLVNRTQTCKMKTNTDKQCEKDEDKSLSKDGNCFRVNSVRRLQLKESNRNSLTKSHVFSLINDKLSYVRKSEIQALDRRASDDRMSSRREKVAGNQ